jgi:integrase
VVGAYIAAASADYAYATLRRQVAAIARMSALDGAPLNTKHHAIRDTLRGIGRTHGGRSRRAAALTIADIRALMCACEKDICGEPAASLTGLRDRALLLLAFAGAFRRSEVAAIDVAHIIWGEDGFIALVKTPSGNGIGRTLEVKIAAGQNAKTCPVAALKSWLDRADIRAGPVFRKIARGGHVQAGRLTGGGIWQIVKKRTAAAGLKASSSNEYLSPQSLRAGFVISAYDAGVPDDEIRDQTRHKNLATTRSYVRWARLATGGAISKVGL